MANTKVTSRVLADDAVGLAQLNISNDPSNGQALTYMASSNDLQWATISGGVAGISSSADATAITINSSEQVGIGTASQSTALEVYSTTAEVARLTGNDEFVYLGLRGTPSGGSESTLGYFGFANDTSEATVLNISNAQDSDISFSLNANEKMRLATDSGGCLLIGKTTGNNITLTGWELFTSGALQQARSGGFLQALNRLSDDGTLVAFYQDTNLEGSISVSGSTVSYNGFSGNHESSGIDADTELGTVVSTIDELDIYPDTIKVNGETQANSKAGQARADHAKIKVSDTQGDVRVYGVLSGFSEETSKPIVTSVGVGSVKVTGACNGGDLLESNGDGTAKVQSDDIIRSKTIGKVTIGNSDTGVKLVSCVLYCG